MLLTTSITLTIPTTTLPWSPVSNALHSSKTSTSTWNNNLPADRQVKILSVRSSISTVLTSSLATFSGTYQISTQWEFSMVSVLSCVSGLWATARLVVMANWRVRTIMELPRAFLMINTTAWPFRTPPSILLKTWDNGLGNTVLSLATSRHLTLSSLSVQLRSTMLTGSPTALPFSAKTSSPNLLPPTNGMVVLTFLERISISPTRLKILGNGLVWAVALRTFKLSKTAL